MTAVLSITSVALLFTISRIRIHCLANFTTTVRGAWYASCDNEQFDGCAFGKKTCLPVKGAFSRNERHVLVSAVCFCRVGT